MTVQASFHHPIDLAHQLVVVMVVPEAVGPTGPSARQKCLLDESFVHLNNQITIDNLIWNGITHDNVISLLNTYRNSNEYHDERREERSFHDCDRIRSVCEFVGTFIEVHGLLGNG